MFIVGLGTAVPRRCYTQRECWDAVQRTSNFQELSTRSRAILKKVLTGQNGINTRYLALETLEEVFAVNPDVLQHRFACHAPDLATEAAANALRNAKLDSKEIDGLLVSSCTGYLCPGLTSYVAERLDLRADILALDLVGQGCGAAMPNLRTGDALIGSGKCQNVLSICVEVCSAAFFLNNDPGVLVSACLFGDGAGAAVLSNDNHGRRPVQWKTSVSFLNPAKRDSLRFEHQAGMLRNVLTPEVPELAAEHVQEVLQRVLSAGGLDRAQITGWILHPGGRDVLTAVKSRLGLSDKEVRLSSAILAEHGNLSSPSVYFVLQAALAESAPGGIWLMSAFGAGFSAHGALLEVD
jgi:predicted naringenin-chalcone synthase